MGHLYHISIDLKIPLRSTKEKICKCVISQIIVQVVGLHHLDNHWVMVLEAAGPNTGTDSKIKGLSSSEVSLV